MEGLRRAYGIAEPVRRGMELKIVRDGTFKPAVLGGGRGGNVHEDILVLGGRDTEVGWEDVFQGLFSFVLLFLYDGFANTPQETSSRNLLPSTMRWRRDCAWINDLIGFFFIGFLLSLRIRFHDASRLGIDTGAVTRCVIYENNYLYPSSQ